jgi:hypothetical protein
LAAGLSDCGPIKSNKLDLIGWWMGVRKDSIYGWTQTICSLFKLLLSNEHLSFFHVFRALFSAEK